MISENWFLNDKMYEFFNSLSFKGYFLAGNSVTNMIAKIPLQGDLDFWISDFEDYIDAFNEISKYYNKFNLAPSMVEMIDEKYFHSKITHEEKYLHEECIEKEEDIFNNDIFNNDIFNNDILPRINLIYTNTDPDSVISNFDLDYCRCYYTPTTGIVKKEGCMKAIRTKKISMIDINNIKKKRILKAIKYGYEFEDIFWSRHSKLLKYSKLSHPVTIDDLNLELFEAEYITFDEIDTNKNDIDKTLRDLDNKFKEISFYKKNNSKKNIPQEILLKPLLTFDNVNENNLEKELLLKYINIIVKNNSSSHINYDGFDFGQVEFETKNIIKKEESEEDELEESEESEELPKIPIKQSKNKKIIIEEESDEEVLSQTLHLNNSTSSYANYKKCPSKKINILKNDISTVSTNTKTIIPACLMVDGNFLPQVIQLNETGTSYVMIEYLPKLLSENAICNFNDMWKLHPTDKHKIIFYQNEVEVYRYSKSYLHTPTDLTHTKSSSYMYSGYDTSANNDNLPIEFAPYYEYIKTLDHRYNQVIANWYENEYDFIAQHSDCVRGMITNAKISIMSFYENNDTPHNYRYLRLCPKNTKNENNLNYLIRLDHGTIVTMCGNTQNDYKHGIKREEEYRCKRISLSFRQMENI